MLRREIAVAVLMLSGFASFADTAARAGDEGPVFVVPSRPGVPVVINGRDASYAVVEGDWGLARPGFVAVTVIGGSPIQPNEVYRRRNSYAPRYGRAPERGRQEIEPAADRALPDPAENFSRSWSTSSDVTPVNDQRQFYRPQQGDVEPVPPTITDPQTYPQNFVPPVIIDRRRNR